MNQIEALITRRLSRLIDFARTQFALIVAAIALIAPNHANAQWSPLPGGGIDLRARAAIVHDDGSGPAVFVGGRFFEAGGLPAKGIAKWNGSNWSALGAGIELSSGGSGTVMTMAVYDDSRGGGPQLYAGGNFSFAGGVAAKNIARWDGRAWHALPIPFDSPASVYSMTVFDDGSGPALYIGGRFEAIGGQPARHLIKWDGVKWNSVGGGVAYLQTTGFTANVMALTIYDDGSGPGLAVGGHFDTVNGIQIRHLALWRNNTWSTLGGNMHPSVEFITSLVPWPGEFGPELICQGDFQLMGGAPARMIARWDSQSWHDMTLPTAPQQEAGGRLRVVHTSDGCPELFANLDDLDNYILRWNGHRWRTLDDAAFGETLWGLSIFESGSFLPYLDMVEFNNQLIVVGSFTQVAGQPAPGVAVWGLDALHPCDADITGDHTINVSDLLAVITSWGICIGCPADQVPCGGDGQVNVTDLLMVITHWGACPS